MSASTKLPTKLPTKGRGWAFAAAVILFAFLPTFTLPAAPARPPEADVRRDATVEAVQRVMPAVVNVATEEVVTVGDPMEHIFREFFDPYYRRRAPNTQFSVGSGVVIDEEGFVLTNFHVVNRARRMWVKFSDGREYEAEKIAGTSSTDVALLRIKAKADERFTAVKLAADDDLLLGETVLALGNPFGLGGSVSRGILSSKSRRPPAENEPMDVPDWLQTDASINPGNSGGPLVNLRGELIGISVAVYREGQGIGFAIPIKRITAALGEIYSPEWLEQMWFGARVRPGSSPLEVLSVQPESPAEDAGLRVGDRVMQIDGKTPRSFVDFNRALLAARNRDVALSIQRGNDRRTLHVRLIPEKAFFNADLIRKKIGATVQAPGAALARQWGMASVQGVLVKEIERGGPAGAADLRAGMVVTAIDGQPVTDLMSAARRLHSKPRGTKVQFELLVPMQRGFLLQLGQATAEITVR